MKPDIFNVHDTLAGGVKFFSLDDPDGGLDLIPLGIPEFDNDIGGLGPGACGILAAATGVGKSSIALSAMLNSKRKVGLVSLEDTDDVIQARLIAAITGIDSLRIRKNDLTAEERIRTAEKIESCKLDHMFFSYPTAGKLSRVMACITALCEAGCELIWVDYVQEIRSRSGTERRNEVAEAMGGCHEAAAEGGAALMMLSQFRRLGDAEKVPQIYHLKESGDLENKARVIILAHRIAGDPKEQGQRVHFRLAKSTYGGEYLKFEYRRDESGTLKPVPIFDVLDDDDF